ncbi:MAG: polysaccharide deacetylase family protein [Steroidobacteraceae bacterium]
MSYIYHDVVADVDISGFPGADASWYKIPPAIFQEQLETIVHNAAFPPERLSETYAPIPKGDMTLFTFDDGGSSAIDTVAEILERYGLRGRFFVVTNLLGERGFLLPSQCRELASRGHVIGSHSASHPLRFRTLSPQAQLQEWRQSRVALEQILGAEVKTASIPGGDYSRDVSLFAAEAGYQLLFTSEPSARVTCISGRILVAGRYMLTRVTTSAELRGLARLDRRLRMKRWLQWNGRKCAKRTLGSGYDHLRRHLLSRRQGKR